MNKFHFCFAIIFSIFYIFSNTVHGQLGTVLDFSKISATSGNFSGDLDPEDNFCRIENIGDLNNDGFTDVAVGTFRDDDGGINTGAVWILFLDSAGSVINQQKISAIHGNFSGLLHPEDYFGYSVCALGDLDGDEILDIAVGAIYDDEGDMNTGAVWILFLNSDGTVKNHQKISKYEGNFSGDIEPHNFFGINITNIGDFDNDGIIDIAVGATGDRDGGFEKMGALWFLYMNSNGTVKDYSKISSTQGNFTGEIDPFDRFGRSCSVIGDLDNNGVNDIAVGAITDDDGGTDRGAVWILYLNSDGSVISYSKISNSIGNFYANLDDDDQIGQSTTPLGDLDGDGIIDLAVSCHNDDDGGPNRGAIYIIFINSNGTVKNFQKISNTVGGFNANLSNGDTFSAFISFLGDINNDGNIEIAAGSPFNDDGGMDKGAIWILTLDSYLSSISENYTTRNFKASPNPFTKKISFSYFCDHPGEELSYEINIFNIEGASVYSIHNTFISTYGLIALAEWDGTKISGEKLDKGTYLSILSVKKGNKLYNRQTEKLILY